MVREPKNKCNYKKKNFGMFVEPNHGNFNLSTFTQLKINRKIKWYEAGKSFNEVKSLCL